MVTKISQFLNTSFSTLSVDDTTNAGVSYPGTLVHTTTSLPATGIGVGLQFQTETSASNTETGMTIESISTDVTAGSEDFDFVVKLMQNGAAAAERFRVTSAGAVSLTGALTAGSFAPTAAVGPANGMFLPAANSLGFVTGAVERFRMNNLGQFGFNVTTSLNANVEIGGGALATAANSQTMVVELSSTSSNSDFLQISNNRNATGGADWTTAGYRLQQKVDSTWMGFIQFNGGGSTTLNNGGISFGTGQTTTGPNSIAERMRIDSTGSVAIGTTSTTNARLSVIGVSGANTLGEIYFGDNTQWTRIGSNFSASAYNNIVGAGDHAIIFSNGTTGTGAFTIAPWASATSGMRIDANGNVSIDLASVTAGYTLDVGGSVRVAGGIVATGEITAYFSDARLKSNITAITNAVDKVMAINGVYYNANDLAVEIAGEDKTVQRVGLLAQEVEAVLPHVVKAAPFDIGDHGVSKTGENYKTLQYDRIVPLLVEAIKEQQQQITQLTKRVEQLENKSST